jgi:hypothetical protein
VRRDGVVPEAALTVMMMMMMTTPTDGDGSFGVFPGPSEC